MLIVVLLTSKFSELKHPVLLPVQVSPTPPWLISQPLLHLLRCTPNNSIRNLIDLNREYMSFCSSSCDFPLSDMSQPLFLLNRSASSSANFLSAYLALSLPLYSSLDDRLASSSLTLQLRLWLLQSPFSEMALLSPLTVFPLCLLQSRASLFTVRVVKVTIRSTIPMVHCHFWSPFLITKSFL